MVFDMAMSFMTHMERFGLIAIDNRTGELVQDLSLYQWTRMAEDFAIWYGELEMRATDAESARHRCCEREGAGIPAR